MAVRCNGVQRNKRQFLRLNEVHGREREKGYSGAADSYANWPYKDVRSGIFKYCFPNGITLILSRYERLLLLSFLQFRKNAATVPVLSYPNGRSWPNGASLRLIFQRARLTKRA